MAKTSEYEFVVLTDQDRFTIAQQELRQVEDQLYRAKLNPAFGDTSALQERAESLKTEYNAVKPEDVEPVASGPQPGDAGPITPPS